MIKLTDIKIKSDKLNVHNGRLDYRLIYVQITTVSTGKDKSLTIHLLFVKTYFKISYFYYRSGW